MMGTQSGHWLLEVARGSGGEATAMATCFPVRQERPPDGLTSRSEAFSLALGMVSRMSGFQKFKLEYYSPN